MKATFTWTVTVDVPDDFSFCCINEKEERQFAQARHDAYLQLQETDGRIETVEDDEEIVE